MKKIKCLLIRHGMTKGNEEGRFIGSTDEHLSESGRDLAMNVKTDIASLSGGKYVLFSSPYKRTIETAKILFDDEDPIIIDGLKEIGFGLLEGKNHRELDGDPEYQRWLDSAGRGPIPGGEDLESFGERTYAGFVKALDDTPEGYTMVIVCHGGTVMSVMSRLTGEDYYSFMTDNLDGYILDFVLNDERITDLTYGRIADRIRSGSDHR